MRHRAIAQGEAVDQARRAGLRAQPFQRVGQGFDVGHVQAAVVDPASAADDDADPRGGAENAGKELSPLLDAHLLGVVEAGEGAPVGVRERLVVDQHRRGDKGAGETATARLMGSCNQAAAETPVEGEEPPRPYQAALVGLPFGGGLRGDRRGQAASRWQRPCR